MKYTSEELNNKLSDISDEPAKYNFEAFGGKSIPYIGWYWRTVDFDRTDGYWFGEMFKDGVRFVGFMTNNKWGYHEFKISSEKWNIIKDLCVAVADNPCRKTLSELNNEIQSLEE